ncbi:MAG: glycosyltransferase [Planctomycetota bacterium]|nr:glycosyltransferase [Planctomycetota bacterium]
MSPLHVILTSAGTSGDVYPYVGLGATLRSRGHRVTLVTSDDFRSTVLDHGLAFRSLLSAGEMEEVLSDPDFWHPVKGALVASRWGVRFLSRHYEVLAEAASDENSVLVASPAVLTARLVQEKLSRPLASVILQPWMVPSVFAPPVMPGGFTLPRWVPRPLGRLYWRSIDAVGDLLIARHLNRLRTALDLKPVRRIFRWWLSPELVIGLFPAWYGEPQADWPPQIRLAGFPLYDGRVEAGLPSEVREFCRAGEPPIAFTFGTGMMHAASWFRAALDACQSLGARGIFLTKYRQQLPDALPPSVLHSEFAPFGQLFPLCAAVVHHGGVGTASRALASGTPQLILPVAFDQFDNAQRLKRLGVSDWLGPKQRSGSRLAALLGRLMTAGTRERCGAVAGRLAADGALETAAEWVEELGVTGGPIPSV